MTKAVCDRLCIIGVGLIGGSIGMAARQRSLARQVVGVGRSAERLQAALQAGAIDEAAPSLQDGVRGADMVAVCTPVGLIVPTIKMCLQWLSPECVVTDVGSVKSAIVQQATGLLGERFVGGHPMAGSEQTGVQNARANLFEGTTWALTPTQKTSPDALQKIVALAQGMGAQVITADPEEHDRAVALTSHLPHALALALVHVAENTPYPQLIGGSFRDGTRVAASSPELWRDIFLHNREHVLWAIDEFIGKLQEVRSAIAEEDAETIQRLFTDARLLRQAFGL
ncbi:MAG: prephenate dehydrogenase [Armatimonadota bacterium]|nr:prephenate dehydrogenase [bacterium]MDW8320924.1 prephenate dehydrogenase [Armatimonadota bacterium]